MNKIIMGFLIIFLLLGGVGCTSTGDKGEEMGNNTRQVVDMAGRTLEIPKEIKKVYATSPLGTIFIYTLEPEMVAGWNNDLKLVEKKYILPEYHNLPTLGSWRGTNSTGSIEEILKVNPDVIINMGDVSSHYISDSEKIQKQLDIPVLMVDGSLEKLEDTYHFMGELLGLEERSSVLADYCIQKMQEIKDKLGQILVEKQLTVYYAEGPKGLETEAKGSLNAEVIDWVGGINVAEPGFEQKINRMQVSLEQILIWDPEIIIISSDADDEHQVYNDIISKSEWQHIQAVKNGKIFEIPYGPYDWLNRPPSIMRIIGMQWLANLLYPEVYDINISEEIEYFFQEFFSYKLSQEEINDLLVRSSL